MEFLLSIVYGMTFKQMALLVHTPLVVLVVILRLELVLSRL